MFNSNDYRARAAAIANERREYRKLERTFNELADNAAWMEQHPEQRIHPVSQDKL
jgi:hypothetical protein